MAHLSEQYTIGEYLLVLEPHEALRNSIMDLKKQFAEGYDCPSAAFGQPHITLVKFQQYEILEARIVHRLKMITRARHSFIVELNDFGSFPAHTIYINVSTKVQIGELVKEIRQMQRLMKMNKEYKPHFMMEPHLSIARKLLPWQYEKGWLAYTNSHFNGRFQAGHVLLLRKRMGEMRYQQVQRFELMNVKSGVRQAVLFD
ncbi:MAG: hypothetical protein NVS3B15_05720 [Sediminibacterium sp.]